MQYLWVMTLAGTVAVGAESVLVASPVGIEFEGETWSHQPDDKVRIEQRRGQRTLRVCGGQSTASVWVDDAEFHDGVIEVDIASFGRSSPGIGFRGRDGGYWRNKIIFNTWSGPRHAGGQTLEQAVVTRGAGIVLVLNVRGAIRQDAHADPHWIHLKIVVKGDKVAVFLEGKEEPVIEIGGMLDPDQSGTMGLCGEDFCFANFQYYPLD